MNPSAAGADLYALCADAWMVAFKRRVAEVEAAKTAVQSQQQQEGNVVVSARDMAEALHSLVPSLSLHEIAKYERLRDTYEAR